MNARYMSTALIVVLVPFSSSATQQDYQQSHNFAQEIGKTKVDFFLPVNFTPSGINYFLQEVYNRPEYGAEILPNNFSHFLQFLEHGITTRQTPAYAQSVIKLFSNKLKAATYVNAYVFEDILLPLQNIVKYYFVGPKPRTPTQLRASINDVLYTSFLSQFDFFKKNPKTFFDSVAQEILTSLNYELVGSAHEVQKEQLRQTLIRFLELCTSKLIWSPEEPAQVWKSVKTTCSHFARLAHDGILDNADYIDDLYWSLTHRFCFFIDLCNTSLPASFYQTVQKDLLNKNVLLCKLAEQETAIISKADILMQSITAGEARARAYQQHGIVT
jgi:hypothetical protein